MAEHDVCAREEVENKKIVAVEDKCFLLCNVNGVLFAMENVCPHAGGSLGDGELNEHHITCPLHGLTFDVTTGKSTTIPALQGKTYPVKVENNRVIIELPDT